MVSAGSADVLEHWLGNRGAHLDGDHGAMCAPGGRFALLLLGELQPLS